MADERETMATETTQRCECGEYATTEHDGEPLCSGCYATDTVECPKCGERGWVADATERGTCEECAVHCESCDDEISSEDDERDFDGAAWCAKCYDDDTLECPQCHERIHTDDKTERGWCGDCRDDHDRDLQSELDDLFGDDKGHLIRTALEAAGLIEAK
jgi:hypothetical protein